MLPTCNKPKLQIDGTAISAKSAPFGLFIEVCHVIIRIGHAFLILKSWSNSSTLPRSFNQEPQQEVVKSLFSWCCIWISLQYFDDLIRINLDVHITWFGFIELCCEQLRTTVGEDGSTVRCSIQKCGPLMKLFIHFSEWKKTILCWSGRRILDSRSSSLLAAIGNSRPVGTLSEGSCKMDAVSYF